MKYLAYILVVLTLGTFACEERKGGLLPSRQEADPQAAQQLRARALGEQPASASIDRESTPSSLAPDEVNELQKVKQDALDRIRTADGEVHPVPGNRGNSQKLYEQGRSLAADGHIAEAQEYFLVACQFGYIAGCHKFAWYEAKGGNAANAGQFYRIACDQGIGKSCNNLGLHYEHKKQWSEALDSYARACLDHHAISCDNLKRLRDERLKAR